MMPIYIAVACALICLILYFLDRRFRGDSIDMLTAAKVLVIGGLMGGGISYTVTSTAVTEVVKAVELPTTQEMFVGQPTF
jgi:predicted cation transporter